MTTIATQMAKTKQVESDKLESPVPKRSGVFALQVGVDGADCLSTV